jgi:hypothetical protein
MRCFVIFHYLTFCKGRLNQEIWDSGTRNTTEDIGNACKMVVRKSEGMKLYERPRHIWEDYTKMGLIQILYKDVCEMYSTDSL